MRKICVIVQGGWMPTRHHQNNDDFGDSSCFEEWTRSLQINEGISFDLVNLEGGDFEGLNTGTPPAVQELAKMIHQSHDDYDGFMVIRGAVMSDYVGTYLSFALQGDRKPILITDSMGSFDNPISSADRIFKTGLFYLATAGQRAEQRKNVNLLYGDMVVPAVTALRYPNGEFKYYNGAGPYYAVENLYHGKVNDSEIRGGLKPELVLPRTDYSIFSHDTIGTYMDHFSLYAQMSPDAVLYRTTKHAGFYIGHSRDDKTAIDFACYDKETRSIPFICVNRTPQSGIEEGAGITGIIGFDNIVNGNTMTQAATLAKIPFVLHAAEGDLVTFKQIMEQDYLGEKPDLDRIRSAPTLRQGCGGRYALSH